MSQDRSADRKWVWILGLWLVLMAGIGYFLLGGPRKGVDFPSYYFAFQALGQHSDPYDAQGISSIAHGQGFPNIVYPYLYPPTFVYGFKWLGGFEYDRAELIWYVILFAALAAMAASLVTMSRSIAARANSKADPVLPVLIACACLSVSVGHNFFNGQINILVACCIAIGLTLSVLQRTVGANLSILAAAAIKVTPAFLLPYIAYRGGKKNLAASATTWIVCAAAALLGIPLSAWESFFAASQKYSYGVTLAPTLNSGMYSNLSFTAWGARLFGLDTQAAKLCAIALVVIFTVALAVPIKRWISGAFAPLIMTMWFVLISPIVWSHHLIMFLPGLAYALAVGYHSGVETFRKQVTNLALVLLVICVPWNQAILKLPAALQLPIGFLPGCLLLGVVFWCATRPVIQPAA